ncbi:DUF5686 family protein [Lutibacter sp.]
MKKLLFITFLIPLTIFSQTKISGVVIDSKTKKTLPYATITTNTNFGTLSNIDGVFSIATKKPFKTITVSYIGYKSVTIPIAPEDKFVKIKLQIAVESLNEVTITATENPALQIIRNAIAQKPKNNIEQALNSFKFTSYNKILVTANPDSINNKIDSVFLVKNHQKTFLHIDSTNYKFKKEIQNQHLYISEKISSFQFQKGKKKKEIILASKMAGLKQPIYELLAVTLQDFSFYNEYYVIAGTKYVNPIAKNALKHYQYKILDTVKMQDRIAILIYFKPKVVKEVTGLEGVLYIDAKSFAITKAIAELKGVVAVKATQNYTFIKNDDIWFPQQTEMILKKGENDKNLNLFGGIVKFQKARENDSIVSTKIKDPSDITYFISKTMNSNIEINPPITIKKSSATIQFDDNAARQPETFWNAYRTDSITKRGKKTYTVLDSLAESEGVDKKINLARNILKGYYPTKYINLNLGKIINLNNYEGLRIGFGGITTTNFSNYLKLESYIAYGTKDKKMKFTLGASIRLQKETNSWFGFNYTNDIKEAASLDFIAENNSFSPINPRNLNISKFYNYKTGSFYIKHDVQPNLEAKIQLSSGKYNPLFNYQFISPNQNLSDYYLTTVSLGIQFNPNSEYMNSPIGKLTIKNKYPQFTLQLRKSIQNLLNSDFNFIQVNFRSLYKIKRLQKATTTFLFEGGIVFGDSPISHLYNTTPNYTFKSPWRKRITFAGKNSFETMGYNEFISDKYAALHIKHQLKPFKLSAKFKPQLTLVSRAAIGDIKNPQYQTGIVFKKLNKIYFESGLEFNELLKGFGLSTFYRYGSYKNTTWSDNLAIKLTFKLRLGF